MCFFGGGGGNRALEKQQQAQADQATKDATEKAAKLRTGMSNIDTNFAGFDDNFFSSLSKNYTDYAMPQLQDQYDEAKKNIVYALARHNNLNSTVRGDQMALLDRENAQNITGIESAAGDYANSARRDVATNKNDVISQFNSTYDVDAANAASLASARVLATPKSFSPLGQMFSNVAAIAAQSKKASESNPENSPYYGAKNYGTSARDYYGVG